MNQHIAPPSRLERMGTQFPSIQDLPVPACFAKLFESVRIDLPSPKAKAASQIKGSWSQEEDELLEQAIGDKESISWEYVASKVKTHTPKQCRERWLVKLNPEVRRSPFEQWEDEIILSERQRIGNHWSLIAQLLPGRTSCSVKNRWYTWLRFQNYSPYNEMSHQVITDPKRVCLPQVCTVGH